MNIEELLKLVKQEWLWAALAAISAVAAIVGALLSWVTAAIIKHRERPEADWAIAMQGYAITRAQRGGLESGFHMSGVMSNVGDGNAFQVTLVAKNCRARLAADETQGMPTKAFMPPGSVIKFGIDVDLDKWDCAEVAIRWTVPPTRLRKQLSTSLSPKDFMEAPGEELTNPETGEVSSNYVNLSPRTRDR